MSDSYSLASYTLGNFMAPSYHLCKFSVNHEQKAHGIDKQATEDYYIGKMAATEARQTRSPEQEVEAFAEMTLGVIDWLDTKGTLGKVKSRIAKRLLEGESKYDQSRLARLFQDHHNFSLKITEVEAVDSSARITETQVVFHDGDVVEGIAVGQKKKYQGSQGRTIRYERPGFEMIDVVWAEEAADRLRWLGKRGAFHFKDDLTGVEVPTAMPELHGQPGSNF
jgi:hypothetical protein